MAGIPTWVSNWETLIKAHEKLLIVAILCLAGIHFYSSVIAAWDRHDSRMAQQAATVVKVDDTASKAMAVQLAALQAQVATQNALIAKQIAQRDQAAQNQQKVDATLPAPQLAARWGTFLTSPAATGIKLGDVDPVTGQLFVVTNAAVLETVEQLELIRPLQDDKAGLQTELDDDQQIIDKQAMLIGNLNTELVDEKKSHVADVNAEKVKTKRAFIRGFKYGLGIGFAAGAYVGHLL